MIPEDLESYPEAEKAVSPKDTKGKGILEESSPCTPEDHVGERVASSPGPWSKIFLDKAEEARQKELLENP